MKLDKRYLFGGISVLALCLAVAGSLYVAIVGDTGAVAAKSSAVNNSVGGVAGAPAAVNAAPATGAGAQLVSAAAPAAGADPYVFQYSGEFLCGQIPPPPPGSSFYLGPGVYNTEISVHDPSNDPVVYIQKKVVALPPPEQVGQPTSRRYLQMSPDSAFQIDCNDIQSFFVPPAGTTCALNAALPNFCKGYVVVEGAKPFNVTTGTLGPAQLDVTVTITVTDPTTNVVQSIEVLTPNPKVVAYPCWSNTAVPPCP